MSTTCLDEWYRADAQFRLLVQTAVNFQDLPPTPCHDRGEASAFPKMPAR
jgi:hypothetical protein